MDAVHEDLLVTEVENTIRAFLAKHDTGAPAPVSADELTAAANRERERLNMTGLLPLTPSVRAVLVERDRQITKGYTSMHDDEHTQGDIGKAGACWALAAVGARTKALELWPWQERPKFESMTAADMLERAAALLLAERERIARGKARLRGAS